jgi:hypothetical protein
MDDFDEHELIFVGTVEVIGVPPRRWSATLEAYQAVRFRVDDTIRGSYRDSHIVVSYPVVRDSATAEPGDAPSLSRRLFSPGSRLLVLAVEDPLTLRFIGSEHFGALPYSLLLVERMREAAAVHRPLGSVPPPTVPPPSGPDRT